MTHDLDPTAREELARQALRARERAYAPYSDFHVGAAILSTTGKVYLGQNVENASYGLSICAERAAVFAMVGAGERAIRAVAIATGAARPTAPCGACRQVLREFGRDARIILATTGGARAHHTLSELLPDSFGPSDLGKPEPGPV